MMTRVTLLLFLFLLIAAPCLGPPANSAPQVVGIEFVDSPFWSPIMSAFEIDNMFPLQFTDPELSFSAHGALDGYTEHEVRQGIVDAIQAHFRRAEIGVPGRMLNIDIRLGAIEPSLGTVHSIGAYIGPVPLFGSSYPSGATFRPDLAPDNLVYTNQLSVTLADTVARIPALSPGTEFHTFDQVVQAVAGTASHEIAHTLNVINHVAFDSNLPIQPIMASGAVGLPTEERLTERRFLDIPATQFTNPGPPPSGPLVFSVPETLITAAGTTYVSDFNFDGSVDRDDYSIWEHNKFTIGTGVRTGDANDDRVTDVSDLNIWNSQQIVFAAESEPIAFELVFTETQAWLRQVNGGSVEIVSLVVSGANPAQSLIASETATYFNDAFQILTDGIATTSGSMIPLVDYFGPADRLINDVEIGLSDGRIVLVRTVPEPKIGLPWVFMGWLGARRKQHRGPKIGHF